MRRTPTLESLQADLFSPSLDTRSHAMIALVALVKRDRSTHAAALPLFHQFVREAKDPSPTGFALRGIEYIEGPLIAQPLRLALLDDPRSAIVAFLLADLSAPGLVPRYVELLARHTDQRLRELLIRNLGRTKHPRAFQPLIDLLPNADLRPHVVEALADLGDPRAIPHLQPLLFDRTDAWTIDNHGPMLSVADLAAAALRTLK